MTRPFQTVSRRRRDPLRSFRHCALGSPRFSAIAKSARFSTTQPVYRYPFANRKWIPFASSVVSAQKAAWPASLARAAWTSADGRGVCMCQQMGPSGESHHAFDQGSGVDAPAGRNAMVRISRMPGIAMRSGYTSEHFRYCSL